MNTTAAAVQAHVTVATIRTWCRHGVIAATKTAGKWVIDTASLARRITIGALKPRRRAQGAPAMSLDLNATYTYDDGYDTTTITVKVRSRVTPSGRHQTTIRGLASLLAHRIDAITDIGNRRHTLEVLRTSQIVISREPRPGLELATAARDEGRLATTYPGTPDLPASIVLDLGEQLRTQLAA